jgi:hypothetical protein
MSRLLSSLGSARLRGPTLQPVACPAASTTRTRTATRHPGSSFCYAHRSNVVPLPAERDIAVTGWFVGGVNLVEFTEPSRLREIATG